MTAKNKHKPTDICGNCVNIEAETLIYGDQALTCGKEIESVEVEIEE